MLAPCSKVQYGKGTYSNTQIIYFTSQSEDYKKVDLRIGEERGPITGTLDFTDCEVTLYEINKSFLPGLENINHIKRYAGVIAAIRAMNLGAILRNRAATQFCFLLHTPYFSSYNSFAFSPDKEQLITLPTFHREALMLEQLKHALTKIAISSENRTAEYEPFREFITGKLALADSKTLEAEYIRNRLILSQTALLTPELHNPIEAIKSFFKFRSAGKSKIII